MSRIVNNYALIYNLVTHDKSKNISSTDVQGESRQKSPEEWRLRFSQQYVSIHLSLTHKTTVSNVLCCLTNFQSTFERVGSDTLEGKEAR